MGAYIPYSPGRSCQNGKTRLARDHGSRQCRRRSPSGARAVLSVIVWGEVPAAGSNSGVRAWSLKGSVQVVSVNAVSRLRERLSG